MNEVSPENLLRSPPWRLRQNRKPPSNTARPAMPGTMYGGSISEDRKLSSAGACTGATGGRCTGADARTGADGTTAGAAAAEAVTAGATTGAEAATGADATTAGATAGAGADGTAAATTGLATGA